MSDELDVSSIVFFFPLSVEQLFFHHWNMVVFYLLKGFESWAVSFPVPGILHMFLFSCVVFFYELVRSSVGNHDSRKTLFVGSYRMLGRNRSRRIVQSCTEVCIGWLVWNSRRKFWQARPMAVPQNKPSKHELLEGSHLRLWYHPSCLLLRMVLKYPSRLFGLATPQEVSRTWVWPRKRRHRPGPE